MKVTILSQLPPPVNGSTLMTQIHFEILQGQELEVELIEREFSFSINEINRFTFRKVFRSFKLFFKVNRIFSQRKPDIFICYFSSSKYARFVDYTVCRLAELRRIPIALYFHTIPKRMHKNTNLANYFFVRLIRRSENIVLGRTMENFFLDSLHAKFTSIIPNTVTDYEELSLSSRNTIRIKPHADQIAFLSNLQPDKGLEDFILFASIVNQKLPYVKFMVIGPVVDELYMKEIHKELARLHLTEKFEFTGFLSGVSKYTILHESDFLVFTSRLLEGQPLSIIEAISCGTPVLSFPAGGAVDLVLDEISGYVSQNVDELCAFYFRMIEDETQYVKLRKTSKQYFEDNYSLSRYQSLWKDWISKRI
jgi:glycosyltransferase involved in cell wall biosynthesis